MSKHRRFRHQSISNLFALLTIATLSAGCQQIPSSDPQPMEEIKIEREQLNKRAVELQELHEELDTKLSLLDTEKKLIASSLIELEQERRKLEVIQKTVLPVNEPDSALAAIGTENVEIESLVVGQLEYVHLIPPDIQFKARIDTGAQTSSLNAIDLTEFERDGKPYVKFGILDPETGKTIELVRQVRKHTRIKEHENDSQLRPVVKMRVILGSIDQRINFTLVDRSNFKHQVLIGRNFLRDFAVVDVSKRFVTSPKKP